MINSQDRPKNPGIDKCLGPGSVRSVHMAGIAISDMIKLVLIHWFGLHSRNPEWNMTSAIG